MLSFLQFHFSVFYKWLSLQWYRVKILFLFFLNTFPSGKGTFCKKKKNEIFSNFLNFFPFITPKCASYIFLKSYFKQLFSVCNALSITCIFRAYLFFSMRHLMKYWRGMIYLISMKFSINFLSLFIYNAYYDLSSWSMRATSMSYLLF